MKLNGITAIITGSTGRLGSEISLALAEAGCNCICHYFLNEKLATELVDKIKKLGRKAVAIQADLTREEQIDALFEKIKAEVDDGLAVPRILINSAGIFTRQKLADTNFKDTQGVLALNLTAPILMCRNFVKLLGLPRSVARPSRPCLHGLEARATHQAKIINMADVGAVRPWSEHAVYCSSKAGLIGATKALAKELAPAICVNAVAPGAATWPNDYSKEERDRQLSFIPAGRIAGTNEITPAIIFLLESDYITGQVLCVDGGRSI
jgi:NAD(P)-dependent dehydrogenase (short-subunit alcohol dehydrogenase family)